MTIPDFDIIETEIQELVSNFSKEEKDEVGDYIAYKEYGLALEVIAAIFVQRRKNELTDEIQMKINHIGRKMGLKINFADLSDYAIEKGNLEKVYAQSDK